MVALGVLHNHGTCAPQPAVLEKGSSGALIVPTWGLTQVAILPLVTKDDTINGLFSLSESCDDGTPEWGKEVHPMAEQGSGHGLQGGAALSTRGITLSLRLALLKGQAAKNSSA